VRLKGSGAFVAGEKQDSVDVTRRMGRDRECKRYVVRGAVHVWDWQFPELFAKGVGECLYSLKN
jgi:hypothetical protein